MINKGKIITTGFFILFFILFSITNTQAQFYNGMQMDFGKNRVQYKDFYWQYQRYKKYDTYFYVGGKELADYASEFARKKIEETEKFFDYTMERRIIFVIFNKLSDFRQSNIGLITGNTQYNIGGVTKIIGNKVAIYFEGDHKKFEQQISAAISEVILNEMFYGSDLKNKIWNSTLMVLPEWYEKGLISYLSDPWNMEIENYVKDGVLSGKFEKFNRLSGADAIYAGHSIWNYVATTYGKSVIPNIVYLTMISKNAESGFMYVLGTSLKNITFEWLHFYDQRYYESNKRNTFPEEEKILKKTKKTRVYYQMKISPDEKYIVYATNQIGKYIIWLYNTETRKSKCILRREHKLEQITDYSYPVIAWHPSGELFSFIIEYQDKIMWYYYEISTKKLEEKPMLYFEKVLDFSYSHDGLKLVISGIQQGQTDIFVHHIAANANEQITKDLSDDFNPRFINKSKGIIFSSNRAGDTLFFEDETKKKSGKYQDIFIYDYSQKSTILTRLTGTPYFNETNPCEVQRNEYTFLSDQNGIINRYIANYDSAICFIDTAVHYRYFTNCHPVSNYSRNILEHDVNPVTGEYTEILFCNGKYHLFKNNLNTRKNTFSVEIGNTEYRKSLLREKSISDSTESITAKKILPDKIKKQEKTKKVSPPADTLNIDINNYIFDKVKTPSVYDVAKSDTLESTAEDTTNSNTPRQLVYFTSFFTDQLVTQVDFGFLNTSYQLFTGGAVYFNPGLNLFFKVGTNDLMEDYKITGGLRIDGSFDCNEYLISIENLKHRMDKQFIIHRQAFQNIIRNPFPAIEELIIKTHTHEFMYLLRYPFNQVASIRWTNSLRYDRNAFLSTEAFSLDLPTSYKYWGGEKLEFIFDNTRYRGINIYNGMRFKVFAEGYKQVNEEKTDLLVLGADFRHYQKIHRSLILASRFATSTSLGNSKLIYYLGSVDNWINLSTRVPTFYNDIPIDYSQNYVYQSLATNMRGFSQNIRNGNSFAVVNNELRWPFIRYFSNRPINSDFLESLQAIGFFDIGTAWCGSSPYAKKNAYDTKIIINNPITVILDNDNDPIVMGYGFGFRTRVLGYFLRVDWAWGIENFKVLPDKIFYLSLSLDF